MPPPGAEWRERALPESIERHVVVAGHRHGRAGKRLDEPFRGGELMGFRALGEIARDDDVVGFAIAHERQHRRRAIVEVLGAEVDVGDVEESSQLAPLLA
jgi:hypothetical protein